MSVVKSPIFGNIINDNLPPIIQNPKVILDGTCEQKPARICLDESILSKHLLFIGGTGCGKTNTILQIISQLKASMNQNDVMIIFDTKGDYYSKFYDPKTDTVLSSSSHYKNVSQKWNIYREITANGWDKSEIEANIQEISWGLFKDAIEGNSNNSFFPNAARDLFSAILTYILRSSIEDGVVNDELLNNHELRRFLDVMNAAGLKNMLMREPDLNAVLSYIGDGQNTQGLGVFAELQTVIRKIFIDQYAMEGDFSIREFVKNKGARTLFVEYDLARGSLLTPIYQLLFDLALKEAMSRDVSSSNGNVYLVFDEFKLLPNLQHIDNAVNFGRSLGIKVIAGLQSISQLYENYGEHRGKNVAAGFMSVFSFQTNDSETRDFVVGRYGKNYLLERYIKFSTDYVEEKRMGNTVEDWEIGTLKVGDAIVGLPSSSPFFFRFDLFRG